jgi:hypothetical protein
MLFLYFKRKIKKTLKVDKNTRLPLSKIHKKSCPTIRGTAEEA